MRINLNNPDDFTMESIQKLIASEDDTVNTQFRITNDGYLILSKDTGSENLQNIVFRLETNIAGNDYVGISASEDLNWVKRVYDVIEKNWPTPESPYCDDF